MLKSSQRWSVKLMMEDEGGRWAYYSDPMPFAEEVSFPILKKTTIRGFALFGATQNATNHAPFYKNTLDADVVAQEGDTFTLKLSKLAIDIDDGKNTGLAKYHLQDIIMKSLEGSPRRSIDDEWQSSWEC